MDNAWRQLRPGCHSQGCSLLNTFSTPSPLSPLFPPRPVLPQILQAIVAKIKLYHKLLSTYATNGKLELQLLVIVQVCVCEGRVGAMLGQAGAAVTAVAGTGQSRKSQRKSQGWVMESKESQQQRT